MKYAGYFLFIALIVAIITSPSEEKFKKFIAKEMNTSQCAPFISYQYPVKLLSLKFFSIGSAKECVKLTPLKRLNATDSTNIVPLALPTYKEEKEYLGLFGRFWKL